LAISSLLPQIAPAKAAVLRELFTKANSLVLEGEPTTTWQFHLAQAVSPHGMLLRGAHAEVALNVAEDGLAERLGEREWWDYDDESRLLAWTLAHSVFLEALGRLLREPLMPHAWSDTSSVLEDALTTVTLGFTVTTADGQATSGLLRLSPEVVRRLLQNTGWQQPALPPEAWQALPVQLRIQMHGARFAPGELTAAEVGDVLVLGRSSHCWRNLYLLPEDSIDLKRRWNAEYDGKRLRITAALSYVPTESSMSQTDTPPTSEANALAGVGVTVDFELGSTSLPLGELANLKPGYVFEIAGNLNQVRVVIRANGTRVGYGELVAVGDVLGVQLLALETNGLR
jgi:type III secretion system YscQ/HrcQ family protein